MSFQIKPDTITILTTYHCTAACKQCCFDCSPQLKKRLTKEQMINFIANANKAFAPITCVFTGGECFSLGQDLFDSIAYAHSLGLATRCVSNGFWARTKEKAQKTLVQCKKAGLDEINFSTGDNHQEWVPFQNIVNGSIIAAKLGIRVIISVEGFNNAKFKYSDVIENPELVEYWKTNPINNIQVINAVWIPFREQSDVLQEASVVHSLDEMKKTNGCDNLLTFIGLNPQNELVSCCGLTMEYIPEMNLGKYSGETLLEKFNKQFDDFLKLWLWVDGPEKILYFAYMHNQNLRPVLEGITHPCQACLRLFRNKEVQKTLIENYGEIQENVLMKYGLKKDAYNRKYLE